MTVAAAHPVLRMDSPIGARMTINGRPVDYFAGTSYYALHGDPRVIAAAQDACATYGIGPGTLAEVPAYDAALASVRAYFDVPEVSYFASGYMSILVLLQGLSDRFDVILIDAVSHFSIRDAVAMLDRPVVAFRHRDPEDLAQKLSTHVRADQRPVIVSDGVFPVTGHIAPLDAYLAVMADVDDALLCIDDAHGVGVLGANGRGTLEHFGIGGPQAFSAATLSKAFGGFGGIVPGSTELVEAIRRRAKLMIGASLPPVPGAAAGGAGARILAENPDMRHRLHTNVQHMREGLRHIGFSVEDTPVPVINLTADADLSAVRDHLLNHDIVVKRVEPAGYSDAPDRESLRIAVFSTHTDKQIDRLVDAIAACI